MGGRFQNWVGPSYLTEIDARDKDLQLSDTINCTINGTVHIFIGPRCPGVRSMGRVVSNWVSEWVRDVVQTYLMWLLLIKQATQYQLMMPIWQSKVMWQWKWLNLVDNFGNNANGATWWTNSQLKQVANCLKYKTVTPAHQGFYDFFLHHIFLTWILNKER